MQTVKTFQKHENIPKKRYKSRYMQMIAAINFAHITDTEMTVFCPLLQKRLFNLICKYQWDHWYLQC